MNHNLYLYLAIAVMAGVTYLIRLLPLTLIQKEIKNQYIKSFLYYVPYVTLSVMTSRFCICALMDSISAFNGFKDSSACLVIPSPSCFFS